MKLHRGWAQSIILAFLALAVSACSRSGASTADGGASDRSKIPLVVYRGDLSVRTLLTGELEAGDAEQLVAPNANVWPLQIRWLAEDGSEVRKGDKVVEFDNSQLVSSVEEMKARAIEAKNRLGSLRAQAASEEANAIFELQQHSATVEKARLEATVPSDFYEAQKFQKLQLDLRKAELELAEAEGKLDATRQAKRAEIEIQKIAFDNTVSKVRRSQERIELLTLSASRDGILVLGNNNREGGRPLQVGDSIFPGAVVGRLPDLATMRITAQLFDVDDGRITEGMNIVATLDTFPELVFTGRIREIDQIADQASSRSLRRFFRTKIDLDRVDTERMRPGMSVKVVIEAQHEDVLLVPRECVVWSEDGPRVKLADGDWATVSLGACDATACVVESGLEENIKLARVELTEG